MSHEKMIIDEVAEYLKMAREHYPERDFPNPVIRFSNAMTRAAGKCSYKAGRFTITFSRPIIQMNPIEDFLNRTVPHEIAHLVQKIVYEKMDHKDSFEFIMRSVFKRNFKESTRCHNFKRPEKRKSVIYKYKCDKCGDEFYVSSIIHSKIQKGQRRYHKPCGINSNIVYARQSMRV